MGCCKQLLYISGKPVIRWCLDGLHTGGVNDIVVVLGPTGGKIADVISDYGLKIAWNNDPTSDMAGSLKVGLKALPDRATAVLVLPVDHPLVSPRTTRVMLATHPEDPGRIIIPVHQGRKGHPVVFPRPVVEELFTLRTLRDVVRRDSARLRLVEVDDEGILLNLNTPDDLREIRSRHRRTRKEGIAAVDL